MDAFGNVDNARRKRWTKHASEFRAHAGYRLLHANAGYKSVEKERRRAAKRYPLFGDPYGEIRLAHITAALVGSHDPTFVPKRATLTHQRKVLRATKVLRSSLMPGAQPTDVFEMSELRRMLRGLEQHLSIAIEGAEKAGRRPHRADSDAAQRYWLVTLCRELIARFGSAPPTMVKEVAGMIGYAPDDATVARYISRAEQEIDSREGRGGG